MSDAVAMKLIQMANGYRVSRLLFVAAELGLADLLAAESRTAETLRVQPARRAIAAPGDASLTPLGAALKSDAPGSARAAVRTLAGQPFWRAWEHVLYSVQTGKPGFEKAWGTGPFDYFTSHPELART